MQGGQEPGRGVYVVRRVLAILIILLLLVLLALWAYHNLLGSGRESDPGSSETAEVNDSGDAEENLSAEDVDGAKEAAINSSRSDSGEPDARGGTGTRTSGGRHVGEDESPEGAQIESDTELVGATTKFQNTVGEGNVNGGQEIPAFDGGGPQTIQPVIREQPVYFATLIPAEEPVIAELVFFEEPIVPEEPAFSNKKTNNSLAVAAVGGSGSAIAGAGGAFASS